MNRVLRNFSASSEQAPRTTSADFTSSSQHAAEPRACSWIRDDTCYIHTTLFAEKKICYLSHSCMKSWTQTAVHLLAPRKIKENVNAQNKISFNGQVSHVQPYSHIFHSGFFLRIFINSPLTPSYISLDTQKTLLQCTSRIMDNTKKSTLPTLLPWKMVRRRQKYRFEVFFQIKIYGSYFPHFSQRQHPKST